MNRIFRNLVPRVVNRKMRGEPIEVSPSDDLTEKVVSWWKENGYAQGRRRRKELRWLGFTLFSWKVKEGILDSYFHPSENTVKVFAELAEKGVIPPLTKDSLILEAGSNVGRNLFALQDAFGCSVVGVDISEEALRLARDKVWKDRSNWEFHLANVLTDDFFSRYEDDHFDVVMTRGHMMHIPLTDDKRRYVDELKRIGRNLVFIEMTDPRHSGTQLYFDKTYALSWDDYVKEYGMTKYDLSQPDFLDKRETVYVWSTPQ